MNSIYRNPEVKRIALKFLILFVIFYVLSIFLFNIRLKGFSEKLIEHNSSIAGAIIEKHPELESEIVGYFTKEISPKTNTKAQLSLKKYGYDKSMHVSLIPEVSSFEKYIKNNVGIYIFILLLVTFLVVFRDYTKMLKKIRTVSKSAEKIVEGDFSIKLEDDREGEFAILGHQFNEMASRIEKGMELSKKEKIFLKDILSDISHQLKTPLSSLIAFNDLLLEGNIEDENTREDFLLRSRAQLIRMEWLIVNLLKIARLEAGAINFEYIETPVIRAIEKALDSLRVKWKEKNQNIIFENKDNNIMLLLDENWMVEAYTNIIKNCIEHTPEGNNIYIKLENTPVFTRIIIADTGSGIAKEDIPHIFQRFYRGKNSVKSDSIGIGLALSKSIIESQGGSINVRSEIGLGTEFEIVFLK